MSTEPSVINRAELRRYAFKVIEAKRPALHGKMTRVSEEFFQQMEAKLKAMVIQHIELHPSSGKTIQ